MNRLTLEWIEAGQVRTQLITDQQPSKNYGTFRIGRDPNRCDLVVKHPTVSKLHVEIFFDPQQNGFYLRNLRETNPPLVNEHLVNYGAVLLHEGSNLLLGELEMRVKEIQLEQNIAPTVVAPHVAHQVGNHQSAHQYPAQRFAQQRSYPHPIQHNSVQHNPVAPHQPSAQVPNYSSQPIAQSAPIPQPAVDLSYGLQCPKCHRVSSYEHLEIGCAWCGTSLAAAQSVLLIPGQ